MIAAITSNAMPVFRPRLTLMAYPFTFSSLYVSRCSNLIAMAPSSPQLQIKPPHLLTLGAILIICAYGLLLFIPVLLAILFVSLRHLSFMTFLLPLMAAAITTFFLPLGFGNPYVVRLARALQPSGAKTSDGFIAQITFVPRIRSGVRALLEDADDIGWLSFNDASLVFQGDSVQLCVPFDCIRKLTTESIGWRGLFLYGPQTVVTFSGLPNVSALKLSERCSWLLPASRKQAKHVQTCLSEKMKLNGLSRPDLPPAGTR